MNAPSPTVSTPRLHPLVATAAVAVTAVSLAGIAVLTGVLPFDKTPAPAAVATTVPATTPAVVAVPPAPTLPPPQAASTPQVVEKIVIVEKPAPTPAPKPAVKAVAKKKAAEPAPVAEAAAAPLPVAAAPLAVAPPAPPPCLNCGTVDNIREVTQPGDASGLGAVAGGVVGGLLGNQVGGGSGKKIATVLGAAGGAYAGHQIEKSRNKTQRYEIDVRMNDGSVRTLAQDSVPAWRIGDRVRVENNSLVVDNPQALPR